MPDERLQDFPPAPHPRQPDDRLQDFPPVPGLPESEGSGEVPPEPVEVRGLGWLIVPTLVAALLGAVIGMLHVANLRTFPRGGPQQTVAMGAVTGAIIGALAGGVFGLIVWVVFPYKNRNPHAVKQEPGEQDKDVV